MKQLLFIAPLALATFVKAWAADEMELTGKLGCGHCNYKVTKGCATAFQAADGKTYVLANPTDDVKKAKVAGGFVKVTGTVTEKDGVATVQASKQELTK
jgi:hypothetical protein